MTKTGKTKISPCASGFDTDFRSSGQDGSSRFPEIVDMQLTYRCNLRCKMCGQWGEKGIFRNKIDELKEKELNTKVWLAVLEEASSHNSEVLLWGGEPLLSRHFRPIVQKASELGVRLSLITNGILLDKFSEFIISMNVRTISISIDGDQETHDSIRGQIGAFSRITEGIRRVIKLRGKSKHPYIEISVVIMKDNEEKLDKIARIGAELDVDRMLFQPLMFIVPEVDEAQKKIMREIFGMEWECSSGWNYSSLCASPEKTKPFLKKLPLKYGKTEIATSLPANADLEKWQNDPMYAFGRKKCLVPWKKINIMPDGNCNFCVDFPDYIIGNVKDMSIEEIWNSPKAKLFRKIMEREGALPVCRRCIWLYNDFTGQNEIEGKRS